MFERFQPPPGYGFAFEGRRSDGPLGLVRAVEAGDTLRFFITVNRERPAGEARVLSLAAALYARNAIGVGRIHWLGNVMSTDTVLCRTACRRREGAVEFGFVMDMAALRACEGAETEPDALVESVSRAMAAAAALPPEKLPELIQAYCAHCATLMKFVNVTYRGMPVYGFAFAVDKHGGLMVMTQESHTVITVYSGQAALAASQPEAPDMPPVPRI